MPLKGLLNFAPQGEGPLVGIIARGRPCGLLWLFIVLRGVMRLRDTIRVMYEVGVEGRGDCFKVNTLRAKEGKLSGY